MRVLISMAFALAAGASIAQAQPAAGGNPVSDSIRSQWRTAERNIRESADLMEEANYAFKPVDTVRSFGEILAHVAGASYMYCSAAKGDAKTPYGEDDFLTRAKTKAEIVKAVADSLAYCDQVFNAATDASLGQMTRSPFGQGQTTRASSLVGNIGHLNEHYGNLVTYFRIKGIVPPSSRRQ